MILGFNSSICCRILFMIILFCWPKTSFLDLGSTISFLFHFFSEKRLEALGLREDDSGYKPFGVVKLNILLQTYFQIPFLQSTIIVSETFSREHTGFNRNDKTKRGSISGALINLFFPKEFSRL